VGAAPWTLSILYFVVAAHGRTGVDATSRAGSVMEFRILGCLQVWDGDRTIDIAADKQRVVLAVLLLRAGQTVPAPELQDQLWGQTPPAKAKNTLQAYVYRLRHLLNFGPGSELVTETGGYRMVLADGALDLHRFEALAARGRSAVKAGQWEEGLAALRSALALWRGPACADVSATGLQADVQRLEDLRVAVAEDAAEVALAVGQQAAMVPPLETLVAAPPYRERLWALLMVALCGTGRPADALAVYRRVRARLSADLGVESGPHLRQLHRDIPAGRPVGGPGNAEGFWLAADGTVGDDRLLLTACVRDRFGDYGLGAVARLAFSADACSVDVLSVSCPVMGRGVEPLVLQRIVEIAGRRGCATVDLLLVPTGRNGVALEFAARAQERRWEDGGGRAVVVRAAERW